jgi:hypothetical protein
MQSPVRLFGRNILQRVDRQIRTARSSSASSTSLVNSPLPPIADSDRSNTRSPTVLTTHQLDFTSPGSRSDKLSLDVLGLPQRQLGASGGDSDSGHDDEFSRSLESTGGRTGCGSLDPLGGSTSDSASCRSRAHSRTSASTKLRGARSSPSTCSACCLSVVSGWMKQLVHDARTEP